MTAGEIEGVGEEEVDGRSTVDICHNVFCLFYYYSHHHNVIVIISLSSCTGGGRENRGGLFLCSEERPQQEYVQVGRDDLV